MMVVNYCQHPIGMAPHSHYISGAAICGGLSSVEADVVRPSACPCCALDRVEPLVELTGLAWLVLIWGE
jgi:hypothetical protein